MKRVVLPTLLACAAWALPGVASAQTTLQNDGFVDNSAAGFQGGFVVGEMAASCFQPTGDFRPQRMQFLFGGDNDGATYFETIKVWRGGGDGAAPTDLVVSEPEIEITSSTAAFSEYDLTQYGLTFSSSFCVGIEFNNSGLPSVARDDDGANNNPGNNWIYAADGLGGFGWNQSNLFGVQGDWVIRVIGTYPGDPVRPDTGNPDTGNPDTGTPDTGNPDTGNPDTGTPDAGTAAPVIFGVEQNGSSPDQDIEITIEGQNFDSSYRYRVGGATLENVAESNGGQLIEAVLLAEDNPGPGTYDLEIRGDFPGASVDERNAVTIDPNPPTLTSISPTSMTLGEDQPVTLTGTNFVGTPTLLIGGQVVAGVPISETIMTANIPGNLFDGPGQVSVIVSTDYGSSSSLTFNVDAPPAKASGCAASGAGTGGLGLLLLGLVGLLRRRR